MKRTVIQYRKGDRPTKFMLLEYIRGNTSGTESIARDILGRLGICIWLNIIQTIIVAILVIFLLCGRFW